MINIVQIGSKFNVPSMAFISDHFIGDADMLIVSISALKFEFMEAYEVDPEDPGINKEDLKEFRDLIKSRQAELQTHYENGGNVFLILDADPFIDITVFKTSTLYEETTVGFIEIFLSTRDTFTLKGRSGKHVIWEQNYEHFGNNFDETYSYVFEKHPGNSVCHIKNNREIVGISVPVGKGNVLVLPNVTFSSSIQTVYEVFTDIDTILKAGIKSLEHIAPEWSKTFIIGEEMKEVEKMNNFLKKKSDIEQQLITQGLVLNEYAHLKRLVSSSGDILEDIVRKVFTDFGYTVHKPVGNRDDLIITYKKSVAVIEIKGVKGSSGEGHATQLEKWVSGYHHDNGIEPKGILIVSTFIDLPPDKRKGVDFPDQMMNYVNRKELCLITGKQLLDLYLQFKSQDLDFKQIHEILFNTIGKVTIAN